MQGALNDAIGRLGTTGERLIALGAVLILLVDLLGDIIFQDYSFSVITWVAALLIVVAVVLRRFRDAALPMDYTWLLIVVGFIAGAAIARELVADVRYDYWDRGGGTVLFALLLYAAGALVLVGSSLLWSDSTD
jgi:uncharacterized membrane protein YhaH (DUF805 family)